MLCGKDLLLSGFATLMSLRVLVLLGLFELLVSPNTLCPLGPRLLNKHILLKSKHLVLPEAQIEITYRVEKRFLMSFQNFYLKASILYYCLIICPLYLLCSLSLFNQYFLS